VKTQNTKKQKQREEKSSVVYQKGARARQGVGGETYQAEKAQKKVIKHVEPNPHRKTKEKTSSYFFGNKRRGKRKKPKEMVHINASPSLFPSTTPISHLSRYIPTATYITASHKAEVQLFFLSNHHTSEYIERGIYPSTCMVQFFSFLLLLRVYLLVSAHLRSSYCRHVMNFLFISRCLHRPAPPPTIPLSYQLRKNEGNVITQHLRASSCECVSTNRRRFFASPLRTQRDTESLG